MLDDFHLEEEERMPMTAPPWIVTFADMMSILLTFFILLLSFSEIDRVSFARIMGSLKTAFGVQKIVVDADPMTAEQIQAVPRQGNASGEGLLQHLNSILPGAFPPAAKLTRQDDREARVLVNVPDRFLFDSAEAALKQEFEIPLRGIADLMREKPHLRLQVFGHTDIRPIRNSRFQNNWELSAARAISVIQFLIEEGQVDARRLVAVGYGASRPIASNQTSAGQDRNRRVEFLFIEAAPEAQIEVDDGER